MPREAAGKGAEPGRVATEREVETVGSTAKDRDSAVLERGKAVGREIEL